MIGEICQIVTFWAMREISSFLLNLSKEFVKATVGCSIEVFSRMYLISYVFACLYFLALNYMQSLKQLGDIIPVNLSLFL